MSDLFETREKVEKNTDWRTEITVMMDGEEQELSIRQLVDPEFWEVMANIDTDELQALQEELPSDKMDELRSLQEQDTLTDDERTRMENLQDEIEQEDVNLFDIISYDTYLGIQQAAIYGVEPDPEDVQYALRNFTDDIDEMYGATSMEQAKEYINDHHVKPMIKNATDFLSFSIGVRVLTETIGDEENLGN